MRISYFPLFAGIAAALLGIIAHIAWWRASRPRDDIHALAITCLAMPVLIAAAACFIHGPALNSTWVFNELFPSVFLGATLGALYINLYPGAQAGSPTMLILLLLDHCGESGLSINDLNSHLDDDIVQAGSVQNLLDEKFVTLDGASLRLAPRGCKLLRYGRMFRRIVGVTEGGG